MLAFVLYGHRARHWSSEARLWDAHDARGLVDLIADALGHPLSLRSADDELAPWLHPGVRASVNDRGRPIGAFGEVHPGVLEHFGIEDAVFAAELRVDALLGRTPKPVQANALPRFPQSTRDVALLLDAGTPFSEIERIVRRNGPKILESWDIFDVYSGKGIPDGKHSVALSMVYRDPNASDPEEGRTLTDDEVNSAHEALVSSLVSKLKAERR